MHPEGHVNILGVDISVRVFLSSIMLLTYVYT